MNSDMIIQWVLSQSPAVKTLSLISPLALVYEPRLKFSIDTMLTPLAAAVQGPINSLTDKFWVEIRCQRILQETLKLAEFKEGLGLRIN